MSSSKALAGLPMPGEERGALRFQDFAGQSALIEKLALDFQLGQFVHAYLFAGIAGVGKRSLATLCVQTLYCTAEEKPCGVCDGCRRAREHNLPDVFNVRPDGNSIKIEKIREVIGQVQLRPMESGTKAVIIEDAQRMTTQAQNCLLKTLETPPGDTVFFLLCEATSALLPTILSRCRVLTLRPMAQEAVSRRLLSMGAEAAQAQEIAAVCLGSMGRALELLQDQQRLLLRKNVLESFFSSGTTPALLQAAAPYKGDRTTADDGLCIIQESLAQALRHKTLGETPPRALYPEAWWTWEQQIELSALARLSQTVVLARKRLASNMQAQLVMEAVLIEIMKEKKV